jgi:hypothetical protein
MAIVQIVERKLLIDEIIADVVWNNMASPRGAGSNDRADRTELIAIYFDASPLIHSLRKARL